MEAKILEAIRSRAVVRFRYDGGMRTVEPHCYGRSTAGNLVLRGYQSGGYSKSGNGIGWKLFEVSEISGWQETDETFATNRSGYNPKDKGMSSVRARV